MSDTSLRARRIVRASVAAAALSLAAVAVQGQGTTAQGTAAGPTTPGAPGAAGQPATQGTTANVQGTQAGTVLRGTTPAQAGTAPPAATVGSVEAGARKNAQCIGCHEIAGYKASFPAVYMVPKIAGQNAKYLENSLLQYRKGERSHPTMRAIAAAMTDQDILDLAAYYAAHGSK